jgi:hypothetical protein
MTDPISDRQRQLVHVLEHLVASQEATTAMLASLLDVHRTGQRLAPALVLRYEAQLATSSQERAHVRALIAQW